MIASKAVRRSRPECVASQVWAVPVGEHPIQKLLRHEAATVGVWYKMHDIWHVTPLE